MRAEFRAPRRRHRVEEPYDSALPVNLSPAEQNFRAELINQHVLVCQPEHIRDIYSRGYFGKGVLSRGRPEHSISERWEEHRGLLLPVVSPSRYEQLLRLAEAALSAQGLDTEAVSQTLLRLSQPVAVEDLRTEARRDENAQREELEEDVEPEGGACPYVKRRGLEVEPEAKRVCRLDPQAEVHPQDLNPDPSHALTSDPNTNPDHDPSSDPTHDLTYDPSSEREPDSDLGLDPNCDLSSELDPGPLVPGPGFVLVVSDSQGDGDIRKVRQTPIALTEYLQLSLEEAFFLVYSLGCLSVYEYQERLSIIQLWRKFRSMKPDFISSFAAYHHFHSRGWVPKGGGGAKYGSDLMLYRKGPPFYHASYSVVVEKVDETFRGSALRPFSWRSLAALSRITANVSKELMMCYVIYPADLSDAELDSPLCLQRLKVQEVIVSRWVSCRERAEQNDI